MIVSSQLALKTHTNFGCAASLATLDKLLDRFPLPPVALPIGDTSLTHIMRLAAHSTTSPTPTSTAMGHSFIMTVQYSHFCRLRYFFLLVPSPSYPLSCVPLCASFPDPTFFIHLPFSLFFFHFRRHLFLHLIFLPLLKNLYIISNGSRVKYRFFNETLQAHFCEKDGIGQKR
jgi:hypothetical protein